MSSSSNRYREAQSAGPKWHGETGLSLIELMVAMGILTIVVGLAFRSIAEVVQTTERDSAKAYATTRARGAMDRVVRLLRNDLVQFNTVAGTPLGVNFDLDDADGPVVRDGLLFYFDSNGTAQIYEANGGQPQSAGFDDQDGDNQADVIGIGVIVQDFNGDGNQDFIDVSPRDGAADDLNGNGDPDPLWALVQVRFDNIGQVSDPDRWRAGVILAPNVFILGADPDAELDGPNVRTFEFSAHNPSSMLYDTAAFGGNANSNVDENELGNMSSVDGIINAVIEAGSIDSITITINTVEVANEGLGRIAVLSGDISSDLITPRTLALMKRNGIVNLPNPALPSNIDP